MEPVAFGMNNWRHSSINVREARPRDLEAVARLENESFETDRVSRRSLREFLRAPHRPVIAATIDDELAGYALVSVRKGARALALSQAESATRECSETKTASRIELASTGSRWRDCMRDPR